ncbi:hypothetical protein [Companilactobacillus sp.]|jgi:hypothetical protein|uniref:hypothetical protein n=1 Tax=Companilactobacillus sp. TaxID=2767905 RepID=UPI0025BE1AEB|nr:hypothetical protein [Companilactobacillus sp.]MCH4007941.1 hypothetical protein [Companilactobacillus sp.]MCH4051880.1 hypothetical protein [Companilactobacillus sp.]MCH4075884.1 hypothetical protein [Companilactobacillus sp.]MCH4124459.1 hypothetical protein [Companilactobacillus sp.]MCH4132578.1 hypothetical protein [Companilactobacillus sp.]
MNIKKTIFIPLLFATICFFGIFLCNSPISNSQAKDKTTNSKIELSNKIIAQNKISYKFKYTLTPNDPLITIFSRDVKRVDLNSLKKELGEKNIGLDLDNNSIHVNLKDNINQNGLGKFQITAIGKDDLDIEIADLNENLLYSKKTIPETALESADDTVTGTENANNNTPENTNIDELHDVESEETSREDNSANKTTQITDSNLDYKQPPLVPGGEDWNQDWLKQDNLLISMGIPKKLDDGRTSYPVLYFGALNYALNHTKVYDSVGGRPGAVGLGSGRKNNITAANSGIINVPKNGNVDAEQQKKNDPNKFLNFTFGDGLLFGDGTAFRPDAVYRGSQRNWTTTNVFDFYKPTGNIMKPAIYGPDFEKLSGDWGLDEKSARFYVKQYSVGSGKNQHHFVAQRIVYRQVLKKGYAIQVTTTQQFDENNSVIITTEFKNVGNKYIDNFQGYTFRDITFLRDHRRKGSKQDNVIRSLGKNRGVYASRNGEFGSRIEFKLSGYPDSPYAWSGRGTRSSFYQSSRKDHFPWNSKGLFNTYNDAFEDIDDVGDKGSEPGFGNSWMGFQTYN